jgi:uncharacterized membrane protein
MTYEITVTITKSRDEVTGLYQDPDVIPHWQPTFRSLEVIEGEPGAVGSRTRFTYARGKGTLELTETVEKSAMPDRYVGVYEAGNVWNHCVNTFTETPEGHTTWTMTNIFRCRGFMRLIIALFPGAFEKQTLKDMTRFKEYVESQP